MADARIGHGVEQVDHRLTSTNTVASSSTPPCTARKSRAETASTSQRPTPGQAKIVSVMIAPPSRITELEADHGDRRDERVLEHVDEQHAPLGQALRPRGAHVVLRQHVEHRGARHARDHRERDRAEHDRGSTRWRTASTNERGLPGEQRVDQEEAGERGTANAGSMRPASGSQPSLHREEQDDESSPSQKIGIETPASEPAMTKTSKNERR